MTGRNFFQKRNPIHWMLYPFSLVYGGIMRLRRWLYQQGIWSSNTFKPKVISVGNLNVGGSGKTPITYLLADYFLQQQKRVAIVTRGYRSQAEKVGAIVLPDENMPSPQYIGDEPFWFRQMLPNLALAVGADRSEQIRQLLIQFPADILLLDDGFQHLKIQRNCDLLLIGDDSSLGNGWVLPAGPLREPMTAMHAADAVMITKAQQMPQICGHFEPVFHVDWKIEGIVDKKGIPLSSWETLLPTGKVVAFCGIAQPESFWVTVQQCGFQTLATRAFPDHFRYDEQTAQSLVDELKRTGAEALLTTEKDLPKIAVFLAEEIPIFAIRRVAKIREKHFFSWLENQLYG